MQEIGLKLDKKRLIYIDNVSHPRTIRRVRLVKKVQEGNPGRKTKETI